MAVRARVSPWFWVGLGVLLIPSVAFIALSREPGWIAALPFTLIVIVAGLVAWDIVSAPHRPEVVTDDAWLTVRPIGPDRAWSAATEIRLPLDAVRDVDVRDPRDVPAGLRLPGTAMPGVITAGFYGLGAQRSFWLVRRSRRVLVVELGAPSPLARLVLEVDDPDGMAAAILSRRRASPRTTAR